jgi:filamentous hemagglutinin family protein
VCSRLRGRLGVWPIFGLSLAGLIGAGAPAQAGPALPTGGQVQLGTASIGAPVGGSLTISQSTAKAVINWSTFSIGQAGTVQFNNGTGATLNVVGAGAPLSQIDGTLSATGGVYLINPSGVIVGSTGVVNVGKDFVASTLGVDPAKFMKKGDLTFSGSSGAAVINEGKIGSLGGNVALIAQTVRNDGQITAAKGTVGLLAGSKVVMRDVALSDGLFAVVVGGAGTSATNDGAISAANAELKANGGNVYALAGNTGGVIKATGVKAGSGQVFLVATGGDLQVTGTVKARGPKGAGGFIEMSGADVSFSSAHVDAGAGGSWLIDPPELTVDSATAALIQTSLNAGTNVTLQTTASTSSGGGVVNPAGNGDIVIVSPISWTGGGSLTLDAYHSVAVDAGLSASHAGVDVSFYYNHNGGSGGSLVFGSGDSLSFAQAAGQSVHINGTLYTLEYDESSLVTALNTGSGNYAMASDLAFGTYTAAPVTNFDGAFNGLGNSITSLTINATAGDVGLFGGFNGSISNLHLAVTLNDTCAGCTEVGGLAGFTTTGSISDVTVSGTVHAPSAIDVGGVVGDGPLFGSPSGIFNTRSSATVTGDQDVGGVAGFAGSTLIGDSNTGAVTGNSAVGGLVGQSDYQISQSYSTGSVTATSGAISVGGLVAVNAGSITTSFASGPVSAPSGTNVGGFVGDNSGVISNAYATGNVTAASGAEVGGFVGTQELGASIQYAYAANVVSSAGGSDVGAFAGSAGPAAINNLSNSVYNSSLNLLPNVGSGGIYSGVVGETTAQMQDPSGEATNFAGWDFVNTWSPPASGFYPQLFGVSHVLKVAVGAGATSVYGDPVTGTFPLDATGLQNGDEAQALTGLTIGTTATNTSNVGAYPITITGSSATGSYDPATAYRVISATDGTLQITPRPITVAFTPAGVTKTYDGTNTATLGNSNFVFSNVVNGDGANLSITAPATYSQADVGTGLTVTANVLSLGGTAAGNYQLTTTAPLSAGNGEIDQRQVTINLIGTVFKPFDGNTNATLAPGNYQLSNIVNGDAVGLNDPANGQYASAGAGSGIPVSVAGADLALTGAKAFDYTLGSYAVNGVSGPIGIIGAVSLTVSLTGTVSKPYDGNTSISNLTAGDFILSGGTGVSLDLSGIVGTYDNPDAGTNKQVIVTGIALTGANASNYTLPSTATGLIGIITPLSISASLTGPIEKTYDSTTYATLGNNYSLAGVLGGDVGSVVLAATSGTYASKNAGSNIGVTFNVVLTGTKALDYTLTGSMLTDTVGKIDQRVISASLTGLIQKTYDGTTTATLGSGNYAFTNVVSSDLTSLGITASAGNYDTRHAGSGKTVTFTGLSLTGGAASNYSLSTASLTGALGKILPQQISAALSGVISKAYDGTTTATLGSHYVFTGEYAIDVGSLNLIAGSGFYDTKYAGTGKFVRFNGLSLAGAAAGDYTLTTSTLAGYNGTITP